MDIKKVVLITGASSGIGKEACRAIARKGHIVYAAARRIDKMEDLRALGVNVCPMDLTVEEDQQRVIEKIVEEQGCLDALINNAGFGLFGPVEELSIDNAKTMFEVNLFGLASLTKLVLPHMRHRLSGRIINVSSVGGRSHTPFGAWYHASKFALEGFSDCLRIELRPHNIDVVIVEPGAIKTEFVSKMTDEIKDVKDSVYDPMLKNYLNLVKDPKENNFGTDPKVIGDLIAKVVEIRKPRTRYVKGRLGWTFLTMRRFLSDRMYDHLVSFAIRAK